MFPVPEQARIQGRWNGWIFTPLPPFSEPPSFFSYPPNIEVIFDFSDMDPGWILDPRLQRELLKKLIGSFSIFLWKGQDRVARKAIINNFKNGGLNVLDFKTMVKSLRLAWLRRFCIDEVLKVFNKTFWWGSPFSLWLWTQRIQHN